MRRGGDAERRVFILIFKVFALELGECSWEPVGQSQGKEREGWPRRRRRGVVVVWCGHKAGGVPSEERGSPSQSCRGWGLGAERGHHLGIAGWGVEPGEDAEGLLGRVWGPEVGWASFPSNPVQSTSAWMSLSLLQN